MEGDPEESDEDHQGPTVLWEKCIQQSIFVDLSEDESLHLSDLERSLALHLSQAESVASEASIHLSGSAELSDLDDTTSESSVVTSQSEKVVDNRTKSSILHGFSQRQNRMQVEPTLREGYEEQGQDTSDEDQEDLPYDGDLGSPYFNQTAGSEGNMSSDGRETLHASPDTLSLFELTATDGNNTNKLLDLVDCNAQEPAILPERDAGTKQDNFCPDASKPREVSLSCPADMLLRHFSQEELLRSGRLIEAETLPEVSLLESMDDTVLSLAPTHNSTIMDSNHSEIPAFNSKIDQSVLFDTTDDKSPAASTNFSSEEEAESKTGSVTSSADSSTLSHASVDSKQSSDNSVVDVVKQENSDENSQILRVPLVRTRSFGEMKYGQGQVHYPLPDFSKVAPKVKIPKASSGPAKLFPQSPSTMHRAQSSPGMLEVISRVLEDSVQPSEKHHVFRGEMEQSSPAFVHHLQAEYDKLLTKYAEAENLIDQMRLGTNTQPLSEPVLYSEYDDHHQSNLPEGSHLASLAAHLPPSEDFAEKRGAAPESNIEEVNTASIQSEQDTSDGDRMTAELRDIISPFMLKVEEFKMNISIMSVNIAEQQMILRSMMEAQDQLERKYISKKEEHRALEMQKYMGLSRNTGIFDPNRLVEGDIFRIGMHLEDIKETIDKNMCEQVSPPHSSSTPTSMKMVHVKPSPTPSPTPSLQEGPCVGFSILSCKMETQKEEEREEEVEETSEDHGEGRLQRSSNAAMSNTGHNSCHSWCSQGSVERLGIQADEEDRSSVSVLPEQIDHSNILANLNNIRSTLRQKNWTPDSCSTLDCVLKPDDECASLVVEVFSSSSDVPRHSNTHSCSESPLSSPCASQRIVSPETDSGFGSSYLNQSTSGPFQPNLLSESVLSQNDALSSTDSEGSGSNLQTAIHSASLSSQQWASPYPSAQTQACGAVAAVHLWVESTTKEPSNRRHRSDPSLPAHLHRHVSDPVLSTSMDTEERGSQVYSCSCNSEAILALQSEMSRLKKDLEEGLVQLPHLAQKMDYLTSKYRRDRQDRRSRLRTPLRPALNSPAKIEDWISSDMDHSKSKGTDSGDTRRSEIMAQFHNSPAESRRGSSVCSGPKFQYKLQGPLHFNREGNCSVKTSALTSSFLKGGGASSRAKQRQQTAVMESFYSKERWSLHSSPSLQKPLLQVSYGSSSSLPASYKVKELPLESMSHHRKRSTQSDTALLPSNVYFQQTLSPAPLSSKTGWTGRTGRCRGSKEEEMDRTLDEAIEVARSMKRTTERMAKRLSANLVRAQLCRKLHNTQPLEGRKHHAL